MCLMMNEPRSLFTSHVFVNFNYVNHEVTSSSYRAGGQMHRFKNTHRDEDRQGDCRHVARVRRLCQYPSQNVCVCVCVTSLVLTILS